MTDDFASMMSRDGVRRLGERPDRDQRTAPKTGFGSPGVITVQQRPARTFRPVGKPEPARPAPPTAIPPQAAGPAVAPEAAATAPAVTTAEAAPVQWLRGAAGANAIQRALTRALVDGGRLSMIVRRHGLLEAEDCIRLATVAELLQRADAIGAELVVVDGKGWKAILHPGSGAATIEEDPR